MQKSDLFEKLATQNTSFSTTDSKIALDTLIDHLSSLLSEKQRIEIRGFGAFSVRERNPIRGRAQVLIGTSQGQHQQAGSTDIQPQQTGEAPP